MQSLKRSLKLIENKKNDILLGKGKKEEKYFTSFSLSLSLSLSLYHSMLLLLLLVVILLK